MHVCTYMPAMHQHSNVDEEASTNLHCEIKKKLNYFLDT